MLFETPATLNDTWGFKPADQNWKSAEEVLRLKEHLNSRGINYLLNVGPDALGRFSAKAVEILREVGKKEQIKEESLSIDRLSSFVIHRTVRVSASCFWRLSTRPNRRSRSSPPRDLPPSRWGYTAGTP